MSVQILASEACLAMIRDFEHFEPIAYPDPGTGGAPWTIAYGHTRGVKPGDRCTLDQAEAWLLEDVAEAEATIAAAVTWAGTLPQACRDALTDFVFNLGPGVPGVKDGFRWLRNGNPSTMLRLINAGDLAAAGEEFPKWNLPPLPGIIRRRREERALWISGLAG